MFRLPRHQFLRFLVVGGLNTVFSYGVYACLLLVGLPYIAANFGALLLGILFSFRTQGALVFGNRDGRLIVRFAACWGLIFLFGIGLIGAMIRLGLDAYWAGALAMIPVTILSYLLQRFLVFGASRRRT
jgi:putative flippase GtrA